MNRQSFQLSECVASASLWHPTQCFECQDAQQKSESLNKSSLAGKFHSNKKKKNATKTIFLLMWYFIFDKFFPVETILLTWQTGSYLAFVSPVGYFRGHASFILWGQTSSCLSMCHTLSTSPSRRLEPTPPPAHSLDLPNLPCVPCTWKSELHFPLRTWLRVVGSCCWDPGSSSLRTGLFLCVLGAECSASRHTMSAESVYLWSKWSWAKVHPMSQ